MEAFMLQPVGNGGPFLVLSIIVLAGGAGGVIARRLRVPAITGQILAGALVGATVLSKIEVARELQPLSTFAMALIAASVGGHLSYRRIHNALRRIVTIALVESFVTAGLVTLAIRFALGVAWPVAALLGCLAIETAPATSLALVRETRAKGTFVKTLLSVVALDNIVCIMLFAFIETLDADYYAHSETGLGVARALADTVGQLAGSVLIAFGLGKATEHFARRYPSHHPFSLTFVAILLSTGLSSYFGLSPLLTALFFGVYLGNTSHPTENLLNELEPIEPLLSICFFTLAGAGLHAATVFNAGVLCLAYVGVRLIGKAVGAFLGGLAGRSSRRIWFTMPLALMPQSAVAIGLIVVLEGDPRIPPDVSSLVGALVLAAVTINEIVGPFLTRFALKKSGETGLDRPRLIEFLQEEYILTDLTAEDKWEALGKLTDFFARAHNVPASQRDRIYDSVVQREKDMPTAVGMGAAIPHGRIDAGAAIRGVLGICRRGIDFDGPDAEPVRLIMLIVTPREHEKHHLEVMAGLAAMLLNDALRQRLFAAVDANDAWEIIESEEARGFNYFLEEEGSAPD